MKLQVGQLILGFPGVGTPPPHTHPLQVQLQNASWETVSRTPDTAKPFKVCNPLSLTFSSNCPESQDKYLNIYCGVVLTFFLLLYVFFEEKTGNTRKILGFFLEEKLGNRDKTQRIRAAQILGPREDTVNILLIASLHIICIFQNRIMPSLLCNLIILAFIGS